MSPKGKGFNSVYSVHQARRRMQMWRKGLAIEEHKELGQRLFAMRNELLKIGVRLSNVYGVSHKTGKEALRAQNVIDKLRCTLDDCVYEEHPGAADPRIYYPGTQGPLATEDSGDEVVR